MVLQEEKVNLNAVHYKEEWGDYICQNLICFSQRY